MNVIWLAERFLNRARYGTRVDDIIHAHRSMPVKFRTGRGGTLGECDKAATIIGVWLEAIEEEALSYAAQSFVYDDKSDSQLDIICCRKHLAEYDMHTGRGPLEVDFNGSRYLVNFY